MIYQYLSLAKRKEEPSSPDVIDANLFKQVEEQKRR